tara:strand:+ start:8718 stop:9440 length:723 start_codon:yes stop_codon:yes gene_type:complete
MITTTKETITLPPLGSLKEYNFVTAAERSDKLFSNLETLVAGSEEKITQAAEKFRADTKRSLEGVSVESEKLSHHAGANRAVLIRREEAAATEPTRQEIIQELQALAAEAEIMAPIFVSPKQMLLRLTLGEAKRSEYLRQLEGVNQDELNAYAAHCVGTKDLQLASALCQIVGPLPKDQRPGFTADELAMIFIGSQYEAVQRAREVIARNPPMAIDIDRAYRTGQKQSVASSLTRAARLQ